MRSCHGLFAPGGSQERHPLAGCDIRVRLVLALAAILAVVISRSVCFGLIASGSSIAVLAAAGTPPRVVIHRFLGPLVLAAAVLLARALLTGTTPVAELDLGFCRLAATREGLFAGALIASRVLGSLGMLVLLCHNTPMHELSGALRWARVPHAWIEIALLMYRYLHLFFAQAVCVVSAQKVRLGYRRLRGSFRSAGSLAGMVILRSLDQAEKSHEAMVARGYVGSLPLPSLPPLSWAQTAIACVGLILILVVYALAERCFL